MLGIYTLIVMMYMDEGTASVYGSHDGVFLHTPPRSACAGAAFWEKGCPIEGQSGIGNRLTHDLWATSLCNA